MTPQDRDLAIRTLLAEAGREGPAGMAAVANVILNRVQAGRYGQGVRGVIQKKAAFEPWSDHVRGTANDPRRFDPASREYQEAGTILDGVAAGVIPDLTKGATHFFAPKAQAALGRNAPAWATGPGQKIGNHTFYSPEGRSMYDPSNFDAVSRSKSPTGLVSPGTTPAPGTPNSVTGTAVMNRPPMQPMGGMGTMNRPPMGYAGTGGSTGFDPMSSTPMAFQRPQPQSMGDVFGSWLTDGMSGKRDNPLLMRALQYAMQPSPSASPPFGGTAANASGGPGIPPVPAPAAGNQPMQLPGSQPQQAGPNLFGGIGDKLSGSPFGMLLSRLAGAI